MANPKDPFETQQYGPTYQPKGSGNEVGNVSEGLKEGDDLPATADEEPEGFKGASLDNLGSYLSLRTKDAQYGNYYSVNPESRPAISHRDVSGGTPVVPSGFASGGGNENADTQKTFIDEVIEKNTTGGVEAHHFIRIGESDYAGTPMANTSYDGINPDAIVAKNERGPGHTLYSDIHSHPDDGTPSSTGIQKRTSLVLKNNRFHPGSQTPYTKDGAWGMKLTNPKGTLGSQQKELGKYDPAAKGYDAAEMMKMGRALIFASTGHGDWDPDGLFLSDLAVLPNLAQLQLPGLKVETSKLDVRAMTSNFSDGNWDLASHEHPRGIGLGDASAQGQYKDTIYGDDHSNNDRTYGQLNSHLEPFAGPLPLGMVVLAATSLLSMLALTVLIRLMVTAGSDPFAVGPNTPEPENPISLPKGKSRYPSTANFFLDLLGIPITESNFAFAIERGLATFYGFDKPLGEMKAQDIIDAALNLASSSGYYASVMRHVVRDLEQTEKAIMNFPTTGILSAVSGALNIVTEFASSTSFRFLMQMASLGDVVIISEQYSNAPMGTELDDIKEGPGTRVGKSRVSSGRSTLVWRQSALPSRYLLPETYAVASSQYGLSADQGSAAIATSLLAKKLVSSGAAASPDKAAAEKFGEGGAVNNGRLTQEYVKHIEDQFEMEYVPFYFQDLRTNEILGFHAFIESVTDDYSPDYNAVSSYGRVDDIRIWKKTSRAINLSFFVAATNPDDFDAMWFDINKLTTLVYPQWSRGQGLTTSDGSKFVMPFSQIPTASPLIRLRLGDLLKSNYSRFNLARLFGLGQEDKLFELSSISKLEKHSEVAAKLNATERIDARAKVISGTRIGQVPNSDTTQGAAATMATPPPTTVEEAEEIGVMGPGSLVNVDSSTKGYYLTEPEDGKRKKVRFTLTTACEVELVATLGGMPISIPGLKAPPGTPYWKVKFVSGSRIQLKEDPGEVGFYVPWQMLSPHESSIAEFIEAEEGVIAAQQADDAAAKAFQEGGADKFFGPDVNAIVRSFESAGGRGLAGHITSLSLGYDAAPWETRRLGSKAPMWVKVTMGFAPIHDIPPGMDADGFNRGAIYNVGKIMNALAGSDIHGENFNNTAEGSLQRMDADNRADLFPEPEVKE